MKALCYSKVHYIKFVRDVFFDRAAKVKPAGLIAFLCVCFALFPGHAFAQGEKSTSTLGKILQNIDTTSGGVLINLAKSMGSINFNGGLPNQLNADGYPTANPTHLISYNIYPSINYSGQWVVKWRGKGAFEISVRTTAIISDTTFLWSMTKPPLGPRLVGTNCRVVFTMPDPAGGPISVRFPTSPTIPANSYDGTMSNLFFGRIGDKSAFDAGGIFTREYISMMRTLNPAMVRTMGLTTGGGGNNQTITDLKYWPSDTVADWRYVSSWGMGWNSQRRGSIRAWTCAGYARCVDRRGNVSGVV